MQGHHEAEPPGGVRLRRHPAAYSPPRTRQAAEAGRTAARYTHQAPASGAAVQPATRPARARGTRRNRPMCGL